jgi:hypothetical protein
MRSTSSGFRFRMPFWFSKPTSRFRNTTTAAAAARAGLRVRPSEQLLWRDLLQARHAIDGIEGATAWLLYAIIVVVWVAALAHSIMVNRREKSGVPESQPA